MRPTTLLCLLVFYILWGADDILVETWTHKQTPHDRGQVNVYPFSLRYRQQLLETTQSLSVVPVFPDSIQLPGPEQCYLIPAEPPPGAHFLHDTLYDLMSLQL